MPLHRVRWDNCRCQDLLLYKLHAYDSTTHDDDAFRRRTNKCWRRCEKKTHTHSRAHEIRKIQRRKKWLPIERNHTAVEAVAAAKKKKKNAWKETKASKISIDIYVCEFMATAVDWLLLWFKHIYIYIFLHCVARPMHTSHLFEIFVGATDNANIVGSRWIDVNVLSMTIWLASASPFQHRQSTPVLYTNRLRLI